MKWYFFGIVMVGNIAMGIHFNETNLNNLYEHISGFSINDQEYKSIEQQGGDPLYGEITFEGFTDLMRELQPTAQDIFYDLGCGVGKVCVQALLTTPMKKCVGIELSSTRLDAAKQVLHQLRSKKKIPQNKQIYFLNENIKNADVHDGTIFYMGCYGDEVMQATLENISKIPHTIRLASIRQTIGHPEFELINTIPIKMTWSDNVPVYIYEKKTNQIRPGNAVRRGMKSKQIKHRQGM